MSAMTRAVLIGVLAAAAAVAVLVGVAAVAPDWASWREATCIAHGCFNEAVRSGPLRQPSNTFSSLAFLFVGALVVALPLRSAHIASRPVVSASRPLRLTFALSSAVVGLGSAFYHMSLTFAGQTVDVVGMYLLSTFIVLYALARPANAVGRHFGLVYATANAALLASLLLVPDLRRYLFAVILVAGLVLEYRRTRETPARSRKMLAVSAGMMALGFLIWNVDNAHLIFDPSSWLQGHALWHVLGAGAAAALYLHYDRAVDPL